MPTVWRACFRKISAKSREVKIVYKVEANGVFVKIPRKADRQAAKALLLLCVERRAIRGALDVLIRYHRA